MARSDSIAAPTLAPTTPVPDPAAYFKPFSWLDRKVENDPGAQFTATTMDVCNGIRTCLQLLQRDMMIRSHNKLADHPDQTIEPVLNEADGERLLLLASAAVQMLSERAEAQIDDLCKAAEKRAAAGGRA